MFQDFSTPVFGYSSHPTHKRSMQDIASQTKEKNLANAGTQVTESQSSAIQTSTISSHDHHDPINCSMDHLTRFLQTSHEMEHELQEQIAWGKHSSQDEQSQAQKLRHYSAPLEIHQKRVSSLAWNRTGGTLAVGLSEAHHESYCSHEGCVVVNMVVQRQRQLPTTSLLLTIPACVTSLRFHPTNPSILLIGLHTGEVAVWDVSTNGERAASAEEKACEHTGIIKHVGWCDEHNVIVSTGSDGLIILRKYCNETHTITYLKRFKITHLDKKQRNQERVLEISGFSGVKREECVVGVVGGGLFHCHLPTAPALHHNQQPSCLNPVTFTYHSRASPITAIKYAPTTTTFAAASADGHVRVFQFRKAEPKWVLRQPGCILDLYWTEDGSVLGMCGWDNIVHYVQVRKGKAMNNNIELYETILVADSSPNQKMVALGTTNGIVEVWQTKM